MDNFWNKVDKTDGCWLWTGATNGRASGGVNYGLFKIPKTRKNITAHRMSYQLAYGEIPEGMFVCHRCDNPLCVNPEHLFLGTPADNVADMDAKGRRKCNPRKREDNGRAKLDNRAVELMRRLYPVFSGGQLAKIFGIGKTQTYRILNHEQWA
jgi:hypothetical protein